MRLSGKRPSSRALERIDVVDALADERAFVEQVLVDVRHGARIRIDAGIAPYSARSRERADAGQADAHAWLQDAVALDTTSFARRSS
jgi:hypothetical protein